MTLVIVAFVLGTGSVFGMVLAGVPKRAVPPPRNEVATTWIGISDDGHYMLRLVLRADGSGDGAYLFQEDEPKVFQLSWDYTDESIALTLRSPLATPTLAAGLTGKVTDEMRIETKGQDWHIRFRLRRETVLETRWRRLVAALPSPP